MSDTESFFDRFCTKRVFPKVGNNENQIISGCRSAEYNRLPMSQGWRVVKYNLHLSGKATDIRRPGIDLRNLRDEALKLKMGGVGYYRDSKFVHLDSGRFRNW